MKHNYITRILVAAVSLSAFASNSAFAADEAPQIISSQLTFFDFVSYFLTNTHLMTWIGIGIFVALVAILVGWLWGRLWNRAWKPWASPLPCYSIASLLAIITILTPMYIGGKPGYKSILSESVSQAITSNAQKDYDKYKNDPNITSQEQDAGIQMLLDEWTKTDQERANTDKVNLFNIFKKVFAGQTEKIDDKDILSCIDKTNQSYIAFMNMNIWGLIGALGCLFILVAVLSYSDIKLIAPSVKD